MSEKRLPHKKTQKATPLMPKSVFVRPRVAHKLTGQELLELSESLADLDWRLLHWLLRYPLQRADDQVGGIARWASRATVYRHVQALAERGLLVSVLPKMPETGKRLYHLDPQASQTSHNGRPGGTGCARQAWRAAGTGGSRLAGAAHHAAPVGDPAPAAGTPIAL